MLAGEVYSVKTTLRHRLFIFTTPALLGTVLLNCWLLAGICLANGGTLSAPVQSFAHHHYARVERGKRQRTVPACQRLACSPVAVQLPNLFNAPLFLRTPVTIEALVPVSADGSWPLLARALFLQYCQLVI